MLGAVELGKVYLISLVYLCDKHCLVNSTRIIIFEEFIIYAKY